jgi:FecR protein
MPDGQDSLSALRAYLDALPAGLPSRRDRVPRQRRLRPALRVHAAREWSRARRRSALRRAASILAAVGGAALVAVMLVSPFGRTRQDWTDVEPTVAVLDGTLWLENGSERRALSAGAASGISDSDALTSPAERSARVRLADSAILTLAPASRIAGVMAAASARNAAPRVEAIRLERGNAHLQVGKLSGLQRFHVFTADADVEVRGTEFDVDLRPGSRPSTCVRVQEGLVLVTAGAQQIFVRPGQTWGCTAEVLPRDLAPRAGQSVAPGALDLRRQNGLFQRALTEERGGRFSKAASIYRRLLARAPDGPLSAQARANLVAVSGSP